MLADKKGVGALATGGVAAVLASACCVGPLLLVSIGLGGAWLANLRVLEPYQPVFIVIALLALTFAYRRIFRPVVACAPGEVCATPGVNRAYRIVFWLVATMVLIAFGFPYIAPFFY